MNTILNNILSSRNSKLWVACFGVSSKLLHRVTTKCKFFSVGKPCVKYRHLVLTGKFIFVLTESNIFFMFIRCLKWDKLNQLWKNFLNETIIFEFQTRLKRIFFFEVLMRHLFTDLYKSYDFNLRVIYYKKKSQKWNFFFHCPFRSEAV